MKNSAIELILVFKKDMELHTCLDILNKAEVKYREGMDSSRGKIYFHKTGFKFVLTFQSRGEKESFLSKYKRTEEIYEMYTPNWSVRKD